MTAMTPAWTRLARFRGLKPVAPLCLGLLLQSITQIPAKDLDAYAIDFRTQLVQKILPYWYETAVDRKYGGYVLSDDASRKAPPATQKQIVTQARMIWGFSHAHLRGLSDGKHDYLRAAEQGYRFLTSHFLDRRNGGYFWSTDLAGHPQDRRKLSYGQSFAIYALVEYFRASGDKSALKHAMDLYQVFQKRAHDSVHGGWIEHFEADWTPILTPTPDAIVEISGFKSSNTHLHLMEAFAELYEVSKDPQVKDSLKECLNVNKTWFYPTNVGSSSLHRHLDWQPVTAPSSAGVSYGHNVEFAWLMLRAETVLGQPLSWAHFDAELAYALRYGYDHERGGLYTRGPADMPASDTDKVWWAQAEMLAALTDGLKHHDNKDYSVALQKLLDFVTTYQANPTDGIWLDTVAADGKPKVTMKAHNWKANYHDVRAIVKFIDAFAPIPKPAAVRLLKGDKP